MRNVICHYHLFKNSGTSFDALLEKNFGKRYCSFDGPFPFSKINQDELLKVIRNTSGVAYSSHQISLPAPSSLEIRVEPVVFVRHPILRIRSVYQFAKHSPSSTPGGELASGIDFAEWVNELEASTVQLASISNEQTRRLGAVYGRDSVQRRVAHKGMIGDLDQAIRNLAAVKLLARTEYYDQDVPKFEAMINELGIKFQFHALSPRNATSRDLGDPLDARLASVEDELGTQVFNKLLDYNRQDLELFDYVCTRLD